MHLENRWNDWKEMHDNDNSLNHSRHVLADMVLDVLWRFEYGNLHCVDPKPRLDTCVFEMCMYLWFHSHASVHTLLFALLICFPCFSFLWYSGTSNSARRGNMFVHICLCTCMYECDFFFFYVLDSLHRQLSARAECVDEVLWGVLCVCDTHTDVLLMSTEG